MGLEYIRRPIYAAAGFQSEGPSTFADPIVFTGDNGITESVETVTSTGTIRGRGVSILAPTGTTADKTFTLPRPTAAGDHKYVWCNTTGVRVTNLTVAGATASGHFAGTTMRTIAFSSNSTKKRDATLVAVSTSQWMISARSTGTSLSA